MSGTLAGVSVTPLALETLAGLPCPERSLELGFPQAAIERPDGGYNVGPLHLRASPMEAAVLALTIQDAIGAAAMAEARRLRAHGHAGADTGVLTRVLDGLRRVEPPRDTRTGGNDARQPTQGAARSDSAPASATPAASAAVSELTDRLTWSNDIDWRD